MNRLGVMDCLLHCLLHSVLYRRNGSVMGRGMHWDVFCELCNGNGWLIWGILVVLWLYLRDMMGWGKG